MYRDNVFRESEAAAIAMAAILTLTPAMIYFSSQDDLTQMISSFIVAWIFWDVFEWTVHRFLMHSGNPHLMKISFLSGLRNAHSEHHRKSDSLQDTASGKATAFAIIIFFSAIFFIFFGMSFISSLIGIIVACIRLIIYEYIHISTHIYDLRWKKKYVSAYIMNHKRHHSDSSRGAYGVTSRWVDALYGYIVARWSRS